MDWPQSERTEREDTAPKCPQKCCLLGLGRTVRGWAHITLAGSGGVGERLHSILGGTKGVKFLGSGDWKARVQIPALHLTTLVTLGRLFTFCKPPLEMGIRVSVTSED